MRGAGGGRPPKPEGQKVHRGRSTVETVVLPAAGRVGEPPSPAFPLRRAAQKRLWAAMWSSPEASQWSERDVPSLCRLVVLQTDAEAWRSAPLLAEMRQLEDRFGLNPYARKQMRWVVEGEDDEPAEAEGEAPAAERRERLRVV